MVDQGEKPYSCAYCSLSSSRKDVIIRHTRNFHPGTEPNRAGDGPPTTANADGDTVHTLSSPSSTPVFNGAGNTQAQPTHNHMLGTSNELCDVFPDPGLSFPDLGFFRGNTNHTLEAGLREDLPVVAEIFPQHESISSDLWDMLLASVPDITFGASNPTPSNPQALPDGPSRFPQQSLQQTKCIFGLDDAGCQQIRANLASYDPDKKLCNFEFPSIPAIIRYVKAYFEYMDPQLPIVHKPTFNAAIVPCSCTP